MAQRPRHPGMFKKGQSGNPKGKPKGTLNKSTRAFREVMQALLEKNEENFEKWIQKIAKRNPRAAYDLLLRSAEFTTPKLTRTELAGSPDGNPVLVKQLIDNISADDAGSADSETVSSGTPRNKEKD